MLHKEGHTKLKFVGWETKLGWGRGGNRGRPSRRAKYVCKDTKGEIIREYVQEFKVVKAESKEVEKIKRRLGRKAEVRAHRDSVAL